MTPPQSLRRPARLSLFLVGLVTTLAAGPAAAQQVPFTAQATEDGVKLRSGVGHSYYVVGTLNQGRRVQVNEILFGWYKIVPPKEVFSYVSQGYVDAQGSGSVGVVNQDQTEVLAANVKGPGRSLSEQTYLKKGTKVRIVGREGSYYKIKPPENAFVYAPPRTLERAPAVTQNGQGQGPGPDQGPGQPQGRRRTNGEASAGGGTGANAAASGPGQPDQPDPGRDAQARQAAAPATQPHQANQAAPSSPGPTGQADQTNRANVANRDANRPGETGGAADRPEVAGAGPDIAAGGRTLAQAAGGADAPAGGDNPSAGSPLASDDPASPQPGPSGGPNQPDSADQPDGPGRSNTPNQPAGPAQPAGQRSAAGPNQPASAPTPPATQPTAGGLPPSKGGPAGPVQTQAESRRLRQLEQQMLPLFNQPLQQQPIDRMIRRYEQIRRTELPTIDQRIVRARLAALRRNQQLARALARIQQAQQATRNDQPATHASGGGEAGGGAAANAPTGAAASEQAEQTLDPAQYDAVGKLVASTVYNGRNLPRLFRLVEPASGYTIGYVEPGDVSVQQTLGRVVGIVGSKSFDSAMGLRVFDLKRIDVLQARQGGR